MTTPVFCPGYAGKCNFTVSGGAATDINVTGWTWTESNDLQETTHTGSGGIQEFIAGLTRGEGEVTFNVDSANYYFATPLFIVAGAKGLLKSYINASKFYAIPVAIASIPIKSAVAGKVEGSFAYKLSGDAGSYVRPV